MEQVLGKKAVFVGCARDVAAVVPRVLSNISRMSELFTESAFIFVENDSRDATKHEIELWCRNKTNARLISLDGLSDTCPIRTIRLASVRNHYLSLIRSEFSTYDFLFVVDCDEVNGRTIDLAAVRRAIQFLEQDSSHAGVFANRDGIYYDLWALRHPELCPGDIWEEVCDYALTHHVTDEEAYKQTLAKRIFTIPPNIPPIEVDSAFGGLGIYKVSSTCRNERNYLGHKTKLIPVSGKIVEVGWQCCEHVSFNSGFREHGEKLFILPDFLIAQYYDTFPASAWRTLIFDSKATPPQPILLPYISNGRNVERNQPCPCGSGQRYKHCHGKLNN
jgi:hypothetical protein